MKKLLLLTAGIMAAATLSFAGPNGVKSLQGGKGINNGFYLNLGFAFPTMVLKNNGVTSSAQSLGFQPNIEIGNQWYFIKRDKIGFGIKVSWFQFGYSSYKPAYYNNKTTNIDLRFIKFGPQFTLGLNEDMALDFSFEISPTVIIGANGQSGSEYGYVAAGALFAPGVRFRVKKFAVGGDIGFGSLSYSGTTKTINSTGGTDNTTFSARASIFYPRIYVGFKF